MIQLRPRILWIARANLRTRSYRVVQGGSWYNLGQICRSACRFRFDPSYRNNYLGFRLVLRNEK